MEAMLCETENELRDIDNMKHVFVEQLSICKEHSEKETGTGFGEFLVYKGSIDAHELESALHYQNVEHIALGVLAVQEKYLNNKQLCNILDIQRERGGLFGQIAVELGFLNEFDLDNLLKMQDEKHIRIGEVLVLFGAISREDMESELNCFHKLA